MIAKKNSRVDLERKRIVLFQIGLLTAGSFTLAAFNYSTPVKTALEKAQVAAIPIDWTTIVDEIPKPEKLNDPIVKPPVEQNNNEQSSISLENNELSENVSKTQNTNHIPEFKVNVSGFGNVDVTGEYVDVTGEKLDPFPSIEASYIGGAAQMQKDIIEELVYPQIDVELNQQGVVYVSFIVEKDGSISNVNIERGVSETIDREAKRIVKGFQKWKPAENAYGKVRTIVRLPLRFILE